MKKALIALALSGALLNPLMASAVCYEATGFETEDDNGIYVQSGTFTGYPNYVKEETPERWLGYYDNDDDWLLSTDSTHLGFTRLYNVRDSASPSGSWQYNVLPFGSSDGDFEEVECPGEEEEGGGASTTIELATGVRVIDVFLINSVILTLAALVNLLKPFAKIK